MVKISSLIRQDREFSESVLSLEDMLKAKSPMPIVINGLAGGAEDAYLSEIICEAKRLTGVYPTVMTDGWFRTMI